MNIVAFWIFRIFAYLAIVFAAVVSAAASHVFHNGAMIPAVIAAVFGGMILGSQSHEKEMRMLRERIDKMEDEVSASLYKRIDSEFEMRNREDRNE